MIEQPRLKQPVEDAAQPDGSGQGTVLQGDALIRSGSLQILFKLRLKATAGLNVQIPYNCQVVYIFNAKQRDLEYPAHALVGDDGSVYKVDSIPHALHRRQLRKGLAVVRRMLEGQGHAIHHCVEQVSLVFEVPVNGASSRASGASNVIQ